ncbi:UDP-glucose:glycoprotein glucosyltransferase 1 [Coccomyxa sp. Obi]|nr:UDP-glucose:glycoprotein glucosyltransferase 1 [Coccomyxa sp. Obi]
MQRYRFCSALLPLCLITGVLLGAPVQSAKARSKGVEVTLKTKWNATSLLLEAFEFLAEEAPDKQLDFIKAWDKAQRSHQNGCWDKILDTAGSFLSASQSKVLQVVLGIRQLSPRLEFFRTQAAAAGMPQGSCCFEEAWGDLWKASMNLPKGWEEQMDRMELPKHAQLQPFDHILAPVGATVEAVNADLRQDRAAAIIVYGAIGTECFRLTHANALEQSRKSGGKIVYVYRPVLAEGCMAEQPCVGLGSGGGLPLPGFGVELAIKNMEYSALDDSKVEAEKEAAKEAGEEEEGPLEVEGFLFKRLIERRPDNRQELLSFRDHLLASSADNEALKVWDMKELGLQAAARIVASSEPLRALTQMAQNFPNLAAALSRVAVPKQLRAELKKLHRVLQGGSSFMLVNGIPTDMGNFDLYSLMEQIRKEVRLSDMMKETGLQSEDIAALVQLRSQMKEVDAEDLRIDLRTPDAIHWLNDIETGRQYWHWPQTLNMLLQPMFPGQLHRVQRNLYSVVALIDPTNLEGLQAAGVLLELYSATWPVRCGLILLPPDTIQRVKQSGADVAAGAAWEDLTASERASLAFMYLENAAGAPAAFKFLGKAREVHAQTEKEDDALSWASVEAAFLSAWKDLPDTRNRDLKPAAALEEMVKGARELNEELVKGVAFAMSKGVAGLGTAVWVNGLLITSSEGVPWEQMIPYQLQVEQQRLQEAVYFSRIQDSDEDLLGAILRAFDAAPKYNPRLLQTDTDSAAGSAQQVALVGPSLNVSQQPWSQLGYLHHASTQDEVKGISHWVIADLDSQEGQKLVLAALGHLEAESSQGARVALIHNPSKAKISMLARAVTAASRLQTRRPKIVPFLRTLLESHPGVGTADEVIALAKEAGLNEKALEADLKASKSAAAALAKSCRKVLGLQAGAAAVVTNGRVVPLADSDPLVAEDFELLTLHANAAQVANQVAAVVTVAQAEGRTVNAGAAAAAAEADEVEEWTSDQLSDAAAVASSVLAHHGAASQGGAKAAKLLTALQGLSPEASNISVPGTGAAVEIWAVLDPLSKTAQRVAPVLQFLADTLQPSIKVFLNPQAELPDMPLKSFYRYSLLEVSMSDEGRLALPGRPAAAFSGLPSGRILTLNMDVPEAWLVEPVRADLDLDNLRLADLGAAPSLQAEFELEALLLTGSCVDIAARSREQMTPRGVQLVLGTSQQPAIVDTIVMSNLGYFQLKAAPGAFDLQLAPGRSRTLYVIDNSTAGVVAQGAAEEENVISTRVSIDSLGGRSMRLNLHKRPGMEDEDVLGGDEGETGSVWGKVSSWLTPGTKDKSAGSTLSAEEDPDCIHIFTVASGHMYERLQKIMVLSVLRTTKNRVKFWFIKNYMSPQMKRFLPQMAAHYSFDYEFVTYKWPTWLHKQTEKQRIIWAYKILFLDVLFPLSLRKVIFVDSDQIVRADFAELWNMDLKGAPLAYTPFCDNNRDMEGFRFWKQGFWKDHLRGRPYHISALYVVDLVRFRQSAAGDQLRVVYDQLSRDPASLSNLDQDLPNYAQHQVPIFSLPQEWLWCETWCGNATKKYAKTIDLCNNPLTKEPKLDSARRIVAEWPGLDEEVATFTAKVEASLGTVKGVVVDASEQGDSTEALKQQQGDADQGAEAVEGIPSRGHDASEL